MGLKENIKYIAQTSTSSVFNVIVSIVRSKIVAILIGTAGFGIIGQLGSLINIANFLSSMGMEQGLMNEVAIAKRNNNKKAYNRERAKKEFRNDLNDSVRKETQQFLLLAAWIPSPSIFFLPDELNFLFITGKSLIN